jgi:DNA-binding NarL/FixJ family response regulator
MDRRRHQGRLGDMGAILRAASTADSPRQDSTAHKRELVADLCRLLGRRMQNALPSPHNRAAPLPPLSPRLKQTLDLLLAGDSEKQIARKLSLSQHTIHVYVKALYRGFGVSSRGELLARFIGNSVPLS